MAPTATAMSQMLATAVSTFRALVTTIQGTGDPNDQLNRMVNSMGDMATMFEQFASAAALNDSTMQRIDQMQQQLNQQVVTNSALNNFPDPQKYEEKITNLYAYFRNFSKVRKKCLYVFL